MNGIHSSARIECDEVFLGEDLRIEADVRIFGRKIRIGTGCTIAKGVVIDADEVDIGPGCTIDERTRITGGSGRMARLEFGDHVYVGNDVKILIPEFRMMDYSKLHNHILANGSKPIRIGYNCWIGQNVILNSSDTLSIGNNVGFGSFSSIQTHASHGELLEGCRIYKVAPVTIEDDAWSTGGGDTIGPGVRIGRRAVVVSPALVTRDVPDYGVVGGIPAKDLSDKIVPYHHVTLDWKMAKLKELVREFLVDSRWEWSDDADACFFIKHDGKPFGRIIFADSAERVDAGDIPTVVITKAQPSRFWARPVSVFDLQTKRYTKTGSELEVALMKYMVSFRARFVPWQAGVQRSEPTVRPAGRDHDDRPE